MRVTHLQSATQIIESDGLRILTDPWLTEGEYYGSWFHYPPFPSESIENLKYDYIYVSHIHPDHVSDQTFQVLPRQAPVLIFDYASKFLKAKIERLGFQVIECSHAQAVQLTPDFSITIYAADNCNPELCGKFLGCANVENSYQKTQIDTLAVFKDGATTILNVNDCPFELAQEVIKQHDLNDGTVNLLLVGYAGAGPHPQCFDFDSRLQLEEAATAKRLKFLKQAQDYIELVQPETYAPFAGTYLLGSRLSAMNEDRGVPTVSEAVDYLSSAVSVGSQGVVLEQLDELDAKNGGIQKSAKAPRLTYTEYMKDVSQRPLAYDSDDWDDAALGDLVELANDRFSLKAQEIGLTSQTRLIVQSDRRAFLFQAGGKPKEVPVNHDLSAPFLRLTVDHNLLHRLLRGPRFAHWNNAEIGSHIHWDRQPDVFDRGLQHCLYFLHS